MGSSQPALSYPSYIKGMISYKESFVFTTESCCDGFKSTLYLGSIWKILALSDAKVERNLSSSNNELHPSHRQTTKSPGGGRNCKRELF